MWSESWVLPISLASLVLWRGSGPIAYYLKFGVYTLTMTVSCGVAVPFYLFSGRSHEAPRLLAWVLGRVCEWTLGMKWTVAASCTEERLKDIREKFNREGAMVVVNHQSCLDVVGIARIWSLFGRLGIVAKREILYFGPIGLLGYLLGVTFIDRKKSSEAISALSRAAAELKGLGVPLLVFPEGTRHHSRTNPDLLPFKKGAFLAAIEAKVPIIPVVFSHYNNIDNEDKVFLHGVCKMEILEAVSTDGLSVEDVPSLIETVREQMRAVFLKGLTEIKDKRE